MERQESSEEDSPYKNNGDADSDDNDDESEPDSPELSSPAKSDSVSKSGSKQKGQSATVGQRRAPLVQLEKPQKQEPLSSN